MFKIIQTFDLRVMFNIYETISKTDINKYAEIGSPSRAPFSNLKYFVVFPPLMIQDSWLFKVVLIQVTKSVPNSKNIIFWRIYNKKQWLTESSTFSISTVTRKPSSSSEFDIFKKSEMTLPLSLINLFSIYAVWFEGIRKGNTLFILVERTLLRTLLYQKQASVEKYIL